VWLAALLSSYNPLEVSGKSAINSLHYHVVSSSLTHLVSLFWQFGTVGSVIVMVIVNRQLFCTSYNTCKDRWHITSNGDDKIMIMITIMI